MTDQQTRAAQFHAFHVPGDPVILFNIWDAGSAQAVAEAGARAIATGSASVGGAQGYGDAEAVPLGEVLANAARIVGSVDLPVTLDFEGGYAVEPEAVAANVARVIAAGVVGINFEDQVIGGEGLHPVAFQAERIAAIRAAADSAGVDLFINARTDMWLKAGRGTVAEGDRLAQALERAAAYAEAGASGFFIPGLTDEEQTAEICAATDLPVNAMMFDAMPDTTRLAELGIARISYASGPWRYAMAALTEAAREAFSA